MKMRWPVVTALLLLFCLSMQAECEPDAIEDVISSMKNSFSTLSSKRELWFENYSQMKKLSDADKENLMYIMEVAKFAMPMVWYLYNTEVANQKQTFPKLATELIPQRLPYHTTFSAEYPFFHVEMSFVLMLESNFQIEILRDGSGTPWKMFLMQFLYEDRTIVFKDQNEDGEILEQITVGMGDFPEIKLGDNFRVNIQVADDCIFTSFWTGDNANIISVPRPLPKKHSWCSKIYHIENSYSISVLELPTKAPVQTDTDDAEPLMPITIGSINIYEGLLIQ